MTDGRISQIAGVVPTRSANAPSQISQIAIVAIESEVPPVAGGAKVSQMFIVAVSKEFVIPPVYIPLSMGNFMATMPYYIGQF